MNTEMTADILNRVRIWNESISRSCDYLVIREKIDHAGVLPSDYSIHPHGPVHIILARNNALVEAAVIHFMSIFSTGYEGNLISSNKFEIIEKIRSQLILDTIKVSENVGNEFVLNTICLFMIN